MRGLYSKAKVGIALLCLSCISTPSEAKIASQPLARVQSPYGSFVVTVDEFERMTQLPYLSKSEEDKQKLLENVIAFKIATHKVKQKPPKELQQIIRDEIQMTRWQYWFNQELGGTISKLDPTDSELQQQYRKDPMIQAKIMRVDVPVTATATERLKLRRAIDVKYKKLQGLSAGQLDQIFRQEKGSDVGIVAGDNSMPVFYQKIRALKAGQITAPFYSGSWLIAYVKSVVPYKKADLAYLEFLKTKIRANMGKQLLESKMKQLRLKSKISYNKKLIKKL